MDSGEGNGGKSVNWNTDIAKYKFEGIVL